MMHVIHGTYRFWPRREAFRNDYCLSCDAPRTAEQISVLLVFHVYWIPLAPLGRWRRWVCTDCGECPHHDRGSSWSFKATLSAVFWICTVAVWIVPVPPDAEFFFWALRVGLPVGAAVMVLQSVRAETATRYRELFATVAPADDVNCPYCGVPLANEFNEAWCPSCRVRRL